MNLNKKIIIIVSVLFLLVKHTNAQRKNKIETYNTKKWIHTIGIGVNAFYASGIPLSRNEVNYQAAHPELNWVQGTNPEDFGLVYDIKIQRKISKNFIGIVLNAYATPLQSWTGDQTVASIITDSMKTLSIYTNQSYVNIGLGYEREIVSTKSNRFSLNASFYAGMSINRTPERTEYDYYEPGHYVVLELPDGVTHGNKAYLTSTSFKNGYFINPSIRIKYNLGKNHGISTELSFFYQKMELEQKAVILSPNTQVGIQKKYSVNAFQIKTCYFF